MGSTNILVLKVSALRVGGMAWWKGALVRVDSLGVSIARVTPSASCSRIVDLKDLTPYAGEINLMVPLKMTPSPRTHPSQLSLFDEAEL